ncbi:hypothetical protein BST95_08215 [Halioglobus japonicus]|uniref:Uncharacterized protein n=1 Tax=Halioglobus japonicus TaxID=930805 RepID=A0AAP8MEB1_9GAMM|nr:hypothetical protein [Halioglobus japonicus]AQA18219.1 hypothetical protein BST95_08215 [Halioglobus japonicus]PLW86226.1 hypothetical protein C0029_07260 [Halioglobus japonicus]GHD13832.1 hypothetical protein GCM10007052_16750 [Halioglobus japonicus]
MFFNSSNKHADNSLRGKSLQRALGKEIPKTLTPYEWEQWYEENGVPEAHSNGAKVEESNRRFSGASRCVWRLDSEA